MHFLIIPATLMSKTSFFFLFKNNCLHCLLLRIQKTFSYNLYLFIHYALFSMLVNDDIVDIKKSDGICPVTFVGDKFSAVFIHLSICSITHSISV